MRTPLLYLLIILTGTALIKLALPLSLTPSLTPSLSVRPSLPSVAPPSSLSLTPSPSVRPSLLSVVPPSPPDLTPDFCATTPLHDRLLEQDSAYAEQTRRLEEAYQAAMAAARPKSLPPPYVLPVVFHIVHNGGSENLSDADVLQSLDHLNQSFANSDYYDQGTGVNTQIQFCLAERTPDNQPTSGITRTTSALTDLDADSEDLDLKNLIRYQPTEYINIWIVKEICGLGLGCGVAGYAYLPGAHGGSRDGIVVEAKWLGKSEANSSVLTHEMGHYLGLRHTFNGGCTNDDCTAQGDFVCDTPPDNSTAAVPCGGSVNSCSTDTDSGFATDQNDLFNNYMDYGYWACYNAFTAGQRDRMYFFLDGRRRSLTTSPACLPPCPAPVAADFSGGDVTIPVGTSLTFGNTSTNASTYQWYIDGAPFSTDADGTYFFNTLGTFRIRLEASSGDPLCFPAFAERTVTVICPITSDFSGPSTLQPGESATYTSTATDATSLSWAVNGTPAGTAPTLDYTFIAPGLYTICLTADNGFCTLERCRNVLVRNESSDCDNTLFVKRYTDADQIQPLAIAYLSGPGDNGYLIASQPGSLNVTQLDAGGEPITDWRLGAEGGGEPLLIADGLRTSDGDLLLAYSRRLPGGNGFQGVAELLRFDPTTGTVVWQTALETESASTSLASVAGTEDVLWTVTRFGGDTFAEIITVDPSTGTLSAGASQNWRSGSQNLLIRDLTAAPGGGHYFAGEEFTTGIGGQSRPFFGRRAPDGTLLWQRKLLPFNGRTVAITTTPTGWVAAVNTTAPTSVIGGKIILVSGSPTGEILQVFTYPLPDYLDAESWDVLADPTGGVWCLAAQPASSPNDPAAATLLLKVADSGFPLSTQRIDQTILGSNPSRGHLVAWSDGVRLLTRQTGSQDPVLYSIGADGLSGDGCAVPEEVKMEGFPIEWETTLQESFFDRPLAIQGFAQPSVQPGSTAAETICAEDCDQNTDCGAPFVYLYQSDGPGEGTALVTRPEGYYLGGQAYGQPLVVATDPAGNVNWSLNLFPPGFGGTVTELRWDEAGFLFGVGRYREQQTGDTYFAFRINPANQTVLWTAPLVVPTGAIRELHVTGISAADLADQYELVGRVRMPAAPENDLALYWQLDRATGATVSTVRSFTTNFGSEFRAQATGTSNRYLAGSFNIDSPDAGALRPTVTSINGLGQYMWSRTYLQPGSATARLFAADIEPRVGGFYLLSGGDIDGTDDFAPDLWLTIHNLIGLTGSGWRLTLPAAVRAEQLAILDQQVAVLAVDANDVPYVALFDLGGNFVWGRYFPFLRYANPGNGTSLHLTEAGITLLATRDLGVATLALIRISMEGETIGSCLPGEEFTAQLTPTGPVFQSILGPTQATSPVVTTDGFGSEPTFIQLGDFSCPIDCPVDDCPECGDCAAPFLFAYQGDAVANWSTVFPTPTAYYLGGSVGDRAAVMAVDPTGAILWQHELLPQGERGIVSEVYLDSDGYVFGYGRYAINGSSQLYSFIFRIEAASGNLAWAHTFTSQNESVGLYDILEGPGNRYDLFGATDFNPSPGTCDAFYYTVDRGTGQLLATRQEYHGLGCESFSQAKRVAGGDLVVSGRFAVQSTGTTSFRATLTRLAPDGTELWSKYYLRPGSATARLYAYALAPTETDRHTLLITGDGAGSAATTSNLWLVQTDTDGDVQRAVEYTFPTAVGGTTIRRTDAGYLILGYTADDATFLLATDASGAVLWANRYDGILQIGKNINSPLYPTADGIVLTGQLAGTGEAVLVRLAADGTPPPGCVGATALSVEHVELPAPFQDDHSLNAYPTNNQLDGTPAYEASAMTFSPLSCPIDCPEPEICDDGIDNNDDGLTDCEDPDLALSCCCTEVPPLELGPDTTLCASQPLTIAADTGFVDYLWQDGLATRVRSIDTPGSYSLIATDSCGRMAFDTLAVRLLTAPTLDLGPDTVVCSESVLPLDAGPGFASYRWIDGSTDPTFTAFGEGSFWVEATDSCGSIQRDTVTVSFDPATVIDLGKIRAACPGDTLSLSVPGFTEYTWYPTTGFDCRDCEEVNYVVGSDTLVWVVAKNATGCLSTDSLRLVTTPGAGNFDMAELCPGDTLLFGAQSITASGDYFQPSPTGCGAQDTLRVQLLATATGSSERQICAGDSLLIGGRYRNTTGVYTDTLPAANGCDSLHTINLTVQPSPVETTAFFLCPGDSVFVFDRFERTSGLYERVYPTAAGCDSTVRIDVSVSSLALDVNVTQAACGQNDEGIALATATGGTGPYSFSWSTGATTARLEQLAPGDYRVTLTDANGCAREETVTVTAEQLELPTVSPTPESCPGTNDGTIAIDDPLAGYRYELGDRSGTVFTGLSPGRYALVATSPEGCVDSLSVVIDGGTGLFVDLPGDTTLRFGDSLRIAPAHNAGPLDRFEWSPAGVFACDTCRTVGLRPDQSLTVGLTLRSATGCVASDEMRIRVDRRELVYIPTAFSPNGDGANDRWLPYPGPGVRRIALAQVFDRWGNLVYEAPELDPNRADAGWDGTFGGRPLNPAVFVYRLRVELLSGETIERYGEVMLLR